MIYIPLDYRKAFTTVEMMLTVIVIMVLAAILIAVVNPRSKLVKAKEIKDILAADAIQHALEAYIIYNGDFSRLLPENIQTGFYHICNQQNISCPIEDGKHVNLVPLVTEEYLTQIPNHSQFSDSEISGYLLRFSKENNATVILTLDEWQALGAP